MKNRPSSPVKNYLKVFLQSERYFCHHSNCLYMGGVDAFKKNGNGIVLMDNGACLLSCFLRNNFSDHNVIFQTNSITSIIYDSHQNKDICFRFKEFILYFNVKSNKKVEGNGYIIDFGQQKLYQLKFHESKLTKKTRILKETLLREIFSNRKFQELFDIKHADTMRLNLGLPPGCDVIRQGNYYKIGFVNPKTKVFNGLAFNVKITNTFDCIQVQIGNRGMYENSVLDGFGQFHFDNKNYYIGHIKKGKFHGNGVLVDPKQKKWTHGIYSQNQLLEVLGSSVNMDEQSLQKKQNKKGKYDSLSKLLNQFHSEDRTFIETKVILNPTQQMMIGLLMNAKQSDKFEHESNKEKKHQIKKIENLQRIQVDYTQRKYQFHTEEAIKEQLKKKQEKVGKTGKSIPKLNLNKTTQNFHTPTKNKEKQKTNDVSLTDYNNIYDRQKTSTSPKRFKDMNSQPTGTTPNRLRNNYLYNYDYTGDRFRDPIYDRSPYRVTLNTYANSAIEDPYTRSKWREYLAAKEEIDNLEKSREKLRSISREERKVYNRIYRYLDFEDEPDDFDYRLQESLYPYENFPERRFL